MRLRFVLLSVLGATCTQACVCAGNWPSVKQAWEKAPFVFLGTVEIAEPDGDGHETIFQEQFVRIRVDETFKGVSAGQTIELHQGADDCSAKFRTGQRFVFYLHQGSTPGSWWVLPCSHSLGNAAPLGDDLLFLRQLPKSAIGTRLSGEVELYEDSAKKAFRRVGGVPNVSVKISGPKGSTIETKTNEDGTYATYNLLPGRYSVSIDVPKGFRIAFPLITGALQSGNETTVELIENGGISISFVLKADTRLSGRVLDAKSSPKTGVCVNLEPVEGRGEDGSLFFDCSKAGGKFEMEMMPAGKYWLVAEDEQIAGQFKSKSTLYYPGVRDRDEAAVVTIEPGKHVEHLDLKLPSAEKRYRFAGRMQFKDGVPVGAAIVTFTSPQHGYTETTGTEPDGSFRLLVVAGMQGQLNGRMPIMARTLKECPEFDIEPLIRGVFRFLDSTPISVSSDSNREDLKLVIPSPSCKAALPPRK